MAMIRKGQVRSIGGKDIKAQAEFIAGLFGVAAWQASRGPLADNSRQTAKRCNGTSKTRLIRG